MTHALLTPVVTLIIWSLVMWVWMLATRLPAMRKAKMHPQAAKHTGAGSTDNLPSEARQVADNYNHLMEQPTIFYALVLAIAIAGFGQMLDVWLAWGYVVLRIAHSILQATINIVMYRFYLFVASTLLLIMLAARTGTALLM
ncbi:MAPEG family protein [Hyphococcus flavus]|uniref:MAPEG family protein n=1 Tax=Hyphococcus flavus TaxID=1866326 RepID=A0AAF0CEJ8_9PROT|nr:MAPEG family protein [Hyphococcus flavus]WDI30299.1 MAPEG family protein [Hyphococcus flavus]